MKAEYYLSMFKFCDGDEDKVNGRFTHNDGFIMQHEGELFETYKRKVKEQLPIDVSFNFEQKDSGYLMTICSSFSKTEILTLPSC